MRGNLVEREQKRINHWKKIGLYEKIQAKNSGGRSFILHDGPPLQTATCILDTHLTRRWDTILRYKWMSGYNAPYVPGWDGHGLPIEHKVSRELQDSGRTEYTPLEVRKPAPNLPTNTVLSKASNLNVLVADWANEYWTIHPEYEAAELETLPILLSKALFIKQKPVYWSIPCATALMSEIEYNDHTSISVYVKLRLSKEARINYTYPTKIARYLFGRPLLGHYLLISRCQSTQDRIFSHQYN